LSLEKSKTGHSYLEDPTNGKAKVAAQAAAVVPKAAPVEEKAPLVSESGQVNAPGYTVPLNSPVVSAPKAAEVAEPVAAPIVTPVSAPKAPVV
jgi:hypothetical protein